MLLAAGGWSGSLGSAGWLAAVDRLGAAAVGNQPLAVVAAEGIVVAGGYLVDLDTYLPPFNHKQ